MSKEELEQFIDAFKSTIHRSQSAYARQLLLGKPAKVIFRDRSLDDFIELGVKVRKDLRLLLTKNAFTDAEKNELKRKLDTIEEYLIKIAHR